MDDFERLDVVSSGAGSGSGSVARRAGRDHLWHGPGMLRRGLHGARRAPLTTALAILLVVGVVGPMLWFRLYAKADLRMVDLAVYRAAGQSLVHGRSLYGYLTPVPQLLPFTYPPFSAVVALPLAAVSPQAADWLWTLASFGVLCWIVLVAFRPFVRRFSPVSRPLVVAVLIDVIAWLLPVRDCFRFGQVGIFLAGLTLLDCVLPKTRWPRGLMLGLATAIKLVPAAFIPYLWLTGRRRAAVVATAWFVGLTAATAIVLPGASKAYWTHYVFDSSRIGNVANTSNQSLRGIAARLSPGAGGLALWVVASCIVAFFGYRWARSASLAGAEVRAVAIVGLLSVLISPVSWIHHLAGFVPIAIGAVLGTGRDVRRTAYALALTVFFMLEVPWWGGRLNAHHWFFRYPDQIVQGGFGLAALFAVWLMSQMDARQKVRMPDASRPEDVSR